MVEDILDLNEFMERVQGDKELLLELFDIYLEDYQAKRKLLPDIIRTQNYEELRGIAHSLKGASGNISAKSIRMIFLKMEEMGKNRNTDGIGRLLIELDELFVKLQKRIDELKIELKK